MRRAKLMARAKDDIDQKAVAARLKTARMILGLTQTEVAARAGMSERAYQNYEQFRVPKNKALVRVAQVLNVKPYWILYGEEPTSPERLGQIESELAEMRRLMQQIADRLDGPASDPAV